MGLSEVQEIMIQRDYTKEMFCIGFQNGQAACIVNRGGKSNPGDQVYYLNDMIYQKEAQAVRIFDFKKQGFEGSVGEFTQSRDKFLPIDLIATKKIDNESTLIAASHQNMIFLFKLEESKCC